MLQAAPDACPSPPSPSLPHGPQVRMASETLDVFAVLANRLGAWSVKAELEDLAFRTLQPEDYDAVRRGRPWAGGVEEAGRSAENGAVLGRWRDVVARRARALAGVVWPAGWPPGSRPPIVLEPHRRHPSLAPPPPEPPRCRPPSPRAPPRSTCRRASRRRAPRSRRRGSRSST
jgi:hypothetical protein